jgi:hypothetical protein
MILPPLAMVRRHRPPRRSQQFGRPRTTGHSLTAGFSLVEALVFTGLLLVAVAGAASLLLRSNQSLLIAREVGDLDALIDTNLDLVQQVSDRYTCCLGSCVAPTISGTTVTNASVADTALSAGQVGSSRACATTDPGNVRYFFPQRNEAGTALNEPEAVDALCADSELANTAFMTPLQQRVDRLPVPPGLQRSTDIRPARILRVAYTSGAGATTARVIRVASILPPMARFCS